MYPRVWKFQQKVILLQLLVPHNNEEFEIDLPAKALLPQPPTPDALTFIKMNIKYEFFIDI